MKINYIFDDSLIAKKAISRGTWVFTSLISDQQKWLHLTDHITRLIDGAHFLFPELSWPGQKEELIKLAQDIFEKKTYLKIGIMEDELFIFKSNHNPVKAERFDAFISASVKVDSIIPSYLKTPSFLLTELEKRNHPEYQEVIFLDQTMCFAEAGTSNLFFILNEKEIHTPRLSSKVLDGVLRKNLIHFFKKNEFNIIEKDIALSELESYQEIWLTNCVQGIRSLNTIKNCWTKKSEKLHDLVVARFGRFGENNG